MIRRHEFRGRSDIILAAMEILTIAQVAERLQVKPRWVYEHTRKRAKCFADDSLPHIKMGRYLRFDWKDVLAWLERQKRGGVINERRTARR
jgi:excisionase family DNA binding protein